MAKARSRDTGVIEIFNQLTASPAAIAPIEPVHFGPSRQTACIPNSSRSATYASPTGSEKRPTSSGTLLPTSRYSNRRYSKASTIHPAGRRLLRSRLCTHATPPTSHFSTLSPVLQNRGSSPLKLGDVSLRKRKREQVSSRAHRHPLRRGPPERPSFNSPSVRGRCDPSTSPPLRPVAEPTTSRTASSSMNYRACARLQVRSAVNVSTA
jgi:hypothetical protein